uniref:Uncharacterized protein n=1 Tax=Anguilla anguilla TaxID=7936 RepID=A0A0E9T613_ANGAN
MHSTMTFSISKLNCCVSSYPTIAHKFARLSILV